MVDLKKLFHKKTDKELEKEIAIERRKLEAYNRTKALETELREIKRNEYQTKNKAFIEGVHKAEGYLNKAGEALIKHVREKKKANAKRKVKLEFI